MLQLKLMLRLKPSINAEIAPGEGLGLRSAAGWKLHG
jgi:hypothetical protein